LADGFSKDKWQAKGGVRKRLLISASETEIRKGAFETAFDEKNAFREALLRISWVVATSLVFEALH
jgi:hypothetical protein